MIGRTLAQYEIVEKIGEGGMGEVYRARDTRLGRDVALKVLPPSAASDPEIARRFQREARTIASLQHPHIVTLHSVEEADGVAFLTMELVEGQTLADLLPPEGLPLGRFFEIGIVLAQAVHAAHEKGVIHRDLKPGNVMIDEAGHLKVLDFGLAKLLPAAVDGDVTVASDRTTVPGRVMGTVSYMSPEQAQGQELDSRSDIFSLGVVLYELATGQRPFQGDTPVATLSAILRDDPPPVTELKPLPRHLGRIIRRCLRKEPDKRFQTARDVANELESLRVELESGELEPAGTTTPSPTASTRRRRGRFLGAAIALLAVVGLIWWGLHTGNQGFMPPDVTVSRLTSAVGVEYLGGWSPDGRFFTYSHSANGPLDIFIQATAGGDPVRLVESEHDDYPPSWSPDNRWIAFVSGRDDRTAIYLVPPLGGPIRHLTDLGFPPLYTAELILLSQAPWSPDGRRLVFGRKDGNRAALWTIDVASGEEVRLTGGPDADDGGAVWSFDGERIAFLRAALGQYGIWVLPAEGGEPKQLLADVAPVRGPFVTLAWSPDNRSLLFNARREGSNVDLWAMDAESGDVRRLTSGLGEENVISVARDGRVLMNDFTHQTDLFLQDIESGEARRLTMHAASHFGAQVSPQGDRVAFSSDRFDNAEILTLELSTGNETRVTDHPESDQNPTWSPDGRTIVFESTRSGGRRLWSIDPEARVPRPLLEDRDASRPRFSPDGAVIGFLSSEDGVSSLWVAAPDGSGPRRVKEDVGDFGWYRDSRRIVYATISSDFREIRAADLETGAEVLIHDEPHQEIQVAGDGHALTYLSARSHFNMNLHLLRLQEGSDGLPRAAGRPVKLTAGDGEWHIHNGGFAPDGRGVVYTRDTDTANIYLIEGLFDDDGRPR